MEINEYFRKLLTKYLNNDLNAEELYRFYYLVDTNEFDDLLSDDILEHFDIKDSSVFTDLNQIDTKIILDDILSKGRPAKRFTRLKKMIGLSISIAAIFVCCFFVWTYNWKPQNNSFDYSYDIGQNQYVKFFNNSDSVKEIVLSDLSIVNVYPNSSIQYPETFSGNERAVFLTGKAFFNISKDSIHPFIVFSTNLKTRVLGTSFLISADTESGIEEVEVSTGKVEVSEYISSDLKSNKSSKTVVLNPNQRVIYERNGQELFKTLSQIPLPLAEYNNQIKSNSKSDVFKYNHQLLPEVFRDLELSYGVSILVENSLLANCRFTGNLTDTNLFTKLRIICLTTQSTYEVVGTDIIIKGGGCK